MNKEDIFLLVDFFNGIEISHQNYAKEIKKLIEKLGLIKKQIEAQDVIQEVQKELAEMDKINE